MKSLATLMILCCSVSGCSTLADYRDPLCVPLQAFVSSVGPDESRTIIFRTSWGDSFKDEPGGRAIYAKRCEHNEYQQAIAVCRVLMEHGAVEFAGHNAKEALQCLSSGSRLMPGVYLEIGEFSFNVGNDRAGQSITLSYEEDEMVGGMALRITADGH